MILGAVVLVILIGTTAYWVGILNRNRQNIYNHWYSIGYHDAEHDTMWYNVQSMSTLIQRAYMDGYNERKQSTWTR